MSATVTYKGNTLTTVNNETKVLETKGTWLEDDISITATSESENGSVYQDEDGYVVLDDEPGVNISVTSLSVTSNGTYTAPAGIAYSPVDVLVNAIPKVEALTVTPSDTNQIFTAGTQETQISYKRVTDGSATEAWSINLTSSFSNGDTFKIVGRIGREQAGTLFVDSVTIDESFTWDGITHAFTYHTGGYAYTLNINPGNIVVYTGKTTDYELTVYKVKTVDGYSPVTVLAASGGSGGLEYEEGTVTFNSITTSQRVQFSKVHSKLPCFYFVTPTDTGMYVSRAVTISFLLTEDDGVVIDENNSASYGMVGRTVIGSTSYANLALTRLTVPSSSTDTSSVNSPRYWATESDICIPASNSYKLIGTYKWVAVWR